jgi:phosphomevalonate kinase
MIRIPGKAMICGEYAVLHGGRALLAPVPRHLSVEERLPAARGQARSEERSSAARPPADSEELSPAGQRSPRSPVVSAALAEPIPRLAGFEREHGLPDPCIDNRELRAPRASGADNKLGVGSSAAECVGIIALRFERAGLRWQACRDEVLFHALAAHERAQGGRGSGADVAACVHGTPIDFQLTTAGPRIRPWSPRVAMTLVWTGRGADTRSRIDRLAAYLSGGGREAARALETLIATGDWVADCLSAAALPPRWRDPLDTHLERIATLTRAAGIDYFPPGFEQLDAWARRHNARVKPCGAGGGDMLVVLGGVPKEAFGSAPGSPRLWIPLNG